MREVQGGGAGGRGRTGVVILWWTCRQPIFQQGHVRLFDVVVVRAAIIVMVDVDGNSRRVVVEAFAKRCGVDIFLQRIGFDLITCAFNEFLQVHPALPTRGAVDFILDGGVCDDGVREVLHVRTRVMDGIVVHGQLILHVVEIVLRGTYNGGLLTVELGGGGGG